MPGGQADEDGDGQKGLVRWQGHVREGRAGREERACHVQLPGPARGRHLRWSSQKHFRGVVGAKA